MKEELLQDLKEAMKNKDTLKKDTITMLRAAILQVEKDSQKTLNDDEICAIVAKEVKKRKESVKEYEDAGREDIANSLKQEVEILSKYLPEQLTEDEIEECVGLDSLTHFGEYEEDSVFVRNDNLKIDYEILRDEDDYYDE